MTIFEQWAQDWAIDSIALKDLQLRLSQTTKSPAGTPEAVVQQAIRLAASSKGIRLWRNNNGACKDDTGRHIRYGLANDSKKINAHLKSSDLIGITPVVVAPADIGRTLGIFTSIEVKRGGWEYHGGARERAQLAWLELVAAFGGIAKFANKKEDI